MGSSGGGELSSHLSSKLLFWQIYVNTLSEGSLRQHTIICNKMSRTNIVQLILKQWGCDKMLNLTLMIYLELRFVCVPALSAQCWTAMLCDRNRIPLRRLQTAAAVLKHVVCTQDQTNSAGRPHEMTQQARFGSLALTFFGRRVCIEEMKTPPRGREWEIPVKTVLLQSLETLLNQSEDANKMI